MPNVSKSCEYLPAAQRLVETLLARVKNFTRRRQLERKLNPKSFGFPFLMLFHNFFLPLLFLFLFTSFVDILMVIDGALLSTRSLHVPFFVDLTECRGDGFLRTKAKTTRPIQRP